jgi:hypothetical protein
MTNPNSNKQKDPDDWVSGDEPQRPRRRSGKAGSGVDQGGDAGDTPGGMAYTRTVHLDAAGAEILEQ